MEVSRMDDGITTSELCRGSLSVILGVFASIQGNDQQQDKVLSRWQEIMSA
jgi:hypothetical protein